MTAAILAVFLAAAPAQPAGAAAAFDKAARSLAAGDLAAAERGFRQVLRLEPQSVPALGNLGVVYARMERYAEAIRTYNRALRLRPGESNLLLNLAIAYVRQGDYSAARPILLKLQSTPQTRELAATCELFTGDPARAIEMLDGLPPTPETLFLYGTAHLRLGNRDQAKLAFAQLIDKAPPAQAHLLLGKAYADNAQFDEAIAELNQALSLPAARLELAKAQIGLRDNYNAERNLREILKTSPSHPTANYYLGALLVLVGRESEGIPYLEQSRAIRPEAWGSYYYLGRALLNAKETPKALALLETAARLNPDEAAVWFQLARAYQAAGRRGEAVKAREKFSAMREASLEKTQQVLSTDR